MEYAGGSTKHSTQPLVDQLGRGDHPRARDAIEAVQVEFPQADYRTVQRYLRRRGRFGGERKIRRIMRQFSFYAEIQRAFVHPTDSNHAH